MKLIFIGVCLPTFDLEISSTSHLMKFTHEQIKDHTSVHFDVRNSGYTQYVCLDKIKGCN